MKFQIMLQILFKLLRRRKVSAVQLAAECGVSARSVYRYIEELSVAGVPLTVERGRNGGVCLPDTYRLPENFFTEKEYDAALNALRALYEQMHDEALKSALEKLAQQRKKDGRSLAISGNILVDGSTWGDAYEFSDKLHALEEATERRECVELLYTDRGGAESKRVVEPHLLIYKQNIWYLYAWCRTRKAFRLFRIGRIRSADRTGETFARRAIDRQNLPLNFTFADAEMVTLQLSVQKKALPDAEEWLGVGCIRTVNGAHFAEATLPAGEVLLSKLLSFGNGIKVLSPAAIAEQVRQAALAAARLYGECEQ